MLLITKTVDGFSLDTPVNFSNIVALRDAGAKLILSDDINIDLSHAKNGNAISLVLLLAWLRMANKKNIKITFLNATDSLKSMANTFGLKDIINF